MRKTLVTALLCLGAMGSTSAYASASFANRSLSLHVGGFGLLGADDPVKAGVPISIGFSDYIDNGFDFVALASFPLMYQNAGVVEGGGGGWIIGGGGQAGVRYLFSEESLRPYAEVHLSYLFMNRPDPQPAKSSQHYAGIGIAGGLDYFVGESVSIGARVYADMYLFLNVNPIFSLGGAGNVAVYF